MNGRQRHGLLKITRAFRRRAHDLLSGLRFMDNSETFAAFSADFPDDSREDNGDIIAPAGQNILAAICSQISLMGIDTTEPKKHSFYGWASMFHVDKVGIRLLLQQPGPWLLIVESHGSWFTGSRAKATALGQALGIINSALVAENRIKNLKWMTKAKFEDLKRQGG